MPQACDGLFSWQGSLRKLRTQIQGEVKWDCPTSLMMLRLVLVKYLVAKSLQHHHQATKCAEIECFTGVEKAAAVLNPQAASLLRWHDQSVTFRLIMV